MNLELTLASDESSLSVRRFSVHEAVSSLFTVSIWARSENPAIDFEAIIGKPASFRLERGVAHARTGARLWTGVCSYIEQVRAVQPAPGQSALSTYHLRIVPELWLLTHRRNYRVFQVPPRHPRVTRTRRSKEYARCRFWILMWQAARR
jgi:type VI secretion system secreted protein VgrG